MRQRIVCAGCPFAIRITPKNDDYLCRHPRGQLTRKAFGRYKPKYCPYADTTMSQALDMQVERRSMVSNGEIPATPLSHLSVADREFMNRGPVVNPPIEATVVDFGSVAARQEGRGKKKAAIGAGKLQHAANALEAGTVTSNTPYSFSGLVETSAVLQDTHEWEADARDSILGNVFDAASGWCVAVIAGVMAKYFGPMLGVPEWFLSRTDMVCNIAKAVCIIAMTGAVVRDLLYISRLQNARQKLEVDVQLGLAKTGYAREEIERELERRHNEAKG